MYRFFVEEENIGEEEITITGKDVNHIKNVLRMKIGETVLISNGNDREYTCKIAQILEDEVRVRVEDVSGISRELPIKVTLFQALPKGDKMGTIIQKMIELGAYEIVPVKTKRCVVKLDEKKAQAKVKRWNAIAESAAKQSKRGIIPKVTMPMTLKEAINKAKEMDAVLIPYEEAIDMDKTRNIIDSLPKKGTIGVFIGPEGGFGKEEVEAVVNNGGKEITLGKRILRTETAGMTLMSVLMFKGEE